MRFWDSSALVPLLVDEQGSAGRLQELKADPVVLIWWGTPVECESALQRRLREGALDAEGARLARENLIRLAAAWRGAAREPATAAGSDRASTAGPSGGAR